MRARFIKKRNRQIMEVYRELEGYSKRLAMRDHLYCPKDYLHHGLISTLLMGRIYPEMSGENMYAHIHANTAARMLRMYKRRIFEKSLFVNLSVLQDNLIEADNKSNTDVYDIMSPRPSAYANDRILGISCMIENALGPRKTGKIIGGIPPRKADKNKVAHLEGWL